MQTAASPPQQISLGQTIPIPTHALPFHATSSQSSLSGATGSHSSGTGSVAASSNAASSSSSLVNPTTLALSLPHSNQSVPIIHVDSQALHYLTLEMPNALRASTRKSLRRKRKGLASLKEAGFSIEGLLPPEGTTSTTEEEEEEELVRRLEMIGSHVGANFAER